ncbi:hypothetical protein VTL71DRAFT_14590 [Oculimacula yallundae]|uniref:Uncharacterized protein n=1 Tax=Oculimacula yallundae TaxID=86028 RepID=A0ABR4CIX0_9HELO
MADNSGYARDIRKAVEPDRRLTP